MDRSPLSEERDQGAPFGTRLRLARGRAYVETGTRLAEEALGLFRATGHASGAAMVLVSLAQWAAESEDDRRALAAYREALGLSASIDERLAITRAFCGLADLAAGHGQPEDAATLVGAVDARL